MHQTGRLLAALTSEPQDTDSLIAKTGLTQRELVEAAGQLEAIGVICDSAVPGRRDASGGVLLAIHRPERPVVAHDCVRVGSPLAFDSIAGDPCTLEIVDLAAHLFTETCEMCLGHARAIVPPSAKPLPGPCETCWGTGRAFFLSQRPGVNPFGNGVALSRWAF